MKKLLLQALALCCVTSPALAVKFNPEAMKSLQQEGDKIIQQMTTLHPYRLPTGQCLHVVGNLQTSPANVVVAQCNGSANQNWRFDETGKLLNQGGRCLGVAADQNVGISDCQDTPQFKWKPSAGNRLVHSSGKCLTADTTTNVTVTPCTGAANQQWR